MNQTHDPIAKLAGQLSRLPGIGAKTAMRLAYFILDMSKSEADALTQAIVEAKERIHFCPICGNYTEQDPCCICADTRRTSDVLCVVKDARDVLAMERTHEFTGRYHVLHGIISPMNGVGPDDISITELLGRIKADHVHEVILATNPDIEGDATAYYIAKLIKPLDVKITRIAHGIPVGGNLEYTDDITLAKALEGRREI